MRTQDMPPLIPFKNKLDSAGGSSAASSKRRLEDEYYEHYWAQGIVLKKKYRKR